MLTENDKSVVSTHNITNPQNQSLLRLSLMGCKICGVYLVGQRWGQSRCKSLCVGKISQIVLVRSKAEPFDNNYQQLYNNFGGNKRVYI